MCFPAEFMLPQLKIVLRMPKYTLIAFPARYLLHGNTAITSTENARLGMAFFCDHSMVTYANKNAIANDLDYSHYQREVTTVTKRKR